MTRMSMLAAACGAVVLAVTAGCSSPGGCRSCRKATAAPAVPAAPAAVAVAEPGTLPPAARYGGQKLCPATGEELGSMGEPVAVTVAGRTVYVCCRGCAKRAQAEPEKTLAAVEADRAAK